MLISQSTKFKNSLNVFSKEEFKDVLDQYANLIISSTDILNTKDNIIDVLFFLDGSILALRETPNKELLSFQTLREIDDYGLKSSPNSPFILALANTGIKMARAATEITKQEAEKNKINIEEVDFTSIMTPDEKKKAIWKIFNKFHNL